MIIAFLSAETNMHITCAKEKYIHIDQIGNLNINCKVLIANVNC